MRFKRTPLILLFILPLFVSCINNADFDQISVNPTPNLLFPLVFFELNQLDFLDDVTNTEITFVTDVTDVDFFQTSTVRDNLIRMDINYEITKTFERRFIFLIEHLDSNGVVVFTHEPIGIGALTTSAEGFLSIDLNVNPDVLNTTQIRITTTIVPGTVLDPNIENTITFKSTGLFFLRL